MLNDLKFLMVLQPLCKLCNLGLEKRRSGLAAILVLYTLELYGAWSSASICNL